MKLTLIQLTKLIEEYKNLSVVCDAARAAGCLEIEGKLQSAIWSTIETIIDFFDPEGWIMWYILENDYGAKGYDAGYKHNTKSIKTPEDLFWIMYSCPK
jgi:hypothetical protein